jgi:Na+:H+ antiporter, NhaC family
MLSGLNQHFVITPWALLPLVLVFGLAILRFPPFVTIFAGALLGGVLAVVFNANQVIAFAKDASLPAPLALIKGIWSALATGYVSNTGQAEIDRLLSRGGMESMLNTVWLILTALAFGAVLERAGLLKRLTEAAISGVRSTGSGQPRDCGGRDLYRLECDRIGSVHRDCAAREDVPRRV